MAFSKWRVVMGFFMVFILNTAGASELCQNTLNPKVWGYALAKKALGVTAIEKSLREARQRHPEDVFWEVAAEAFELSTHIKGDIQRVPKTGPLVLAGNHPLGIIDGLVSIKTFAEIRPDLKVLINQKLIEFFPEEVRDVFIPIDLSATFNNSAAIRANRAAIERGTSHVRDGGALLLFPAVEISTPEKLLSEPVDRKWNQSRLGAIVLEANASFVPFYFSSRNSALFNHLGAVIKQLEAKKWNMDLVRNLRLSLIPREALRFKGRTVEMIVGPSIAPHRFDNFRPENNSKWPNARAGERAAADFMQALSSSLKILSQNPEGAQSPVKAQDSQHQTPIDPPVEKSLLLQEVQSLLNHPAALLLEEQVRLDDGASGDFPIQIFIARGSEIPHITHEIGRLREITFRAANEGSGKSSDNDQFDPHYLQMFIWQPQTQQILGAYRMAKVKDVVAAHGVEGLYSHSLFQYKEAFFKEVPNGLELGRSFVIREFQRSGLFKYLFKGIAELFYQQRDIENIFGPVSIPNDFTELSQSILVEYFLHHYGAKSELKDLVAPLNKFEVTDLEGGLLARDISTLVQSMSVQKKGQITPDEAALKMMISALEDQKNQVPVLLATYAQLGARYVLFNRDPDFSNVLDGLIVVKSRDLNPMWLKMLLGKSKAAEYLKPD